MTLEAMEFIRRFSMHYLSRSHFGILAKGFVRIRHYGIVSSTCKAACAVVIKEQLPPMENHAKPNKEINNPLQCPCCKKETMQTVLRFHRRRPSEDWEDMAKKLLECLV